MFSFITNLVSSAPAIYNISMYKLYPYFTNDGSVGLYSENDNDIYHSTYGALTEAYEKFILPADIDFYIKNQHKIKILDICYGIGYNSKSFLNFYLKKYFESKKQHIGSIYTDNNLKEQNIDTIHTNNKYKEDLLNYNEKVYTNNVYMKNSPTLNIKNTNLKIYIKAIDTDKILALLSPFIICNKKKLPENYKLPFYNEKISKMLNKPQKNQIEFSELINVIFFEKIAEKFPEIYKNQDILNILANKDYREFFEPFICRLFEVNKSRVCKHKHLMEITAFLHNIYYKYVSNRYKKALNSPIFNDFIFDIKINDARMELLNDNNMYNLIFLDAFTPAKCPALWSIDFFKLLFKHLDYNGKILTYSNSAAVRNAFVEAGFIVGKIYSTSQNKYTGTIAVKNKKFIKHKLSNYDLGLLKTKAGIFYRDENLNGQNEAIIERHKIDVENSNLMSSSQYIKQYKKHTEAI